VDGKGIFVKLCAHRRIGEVAIRGVKDAGTDGARAANDFLFF
jgi:hypothetical protein